MEPKLCRCGKPTAPYWIGGAGNGMYDDGRCSECQETMAKGEAESRRLYRESQQSLDQYAGNDFYSGIARGSMRVRGR